MLTDVDSIIWLTMLCSEIIRTNVGHEEVRIDSECAEGREEEESRRKLCRRTRNQQNEDQDGKRATESCLRCTNGTNNHFNTSQQEND